MFTLNHFIWIFICILLFILSVILIRKYRPNYNTYFSIALVICLISELIKILCSIRFVPSSNNQSIFPYIELKHLPFHLCSMQIIFIFIVRFTQNEKLREYLLAFMFPSCITGGISAILLPSIFQNVLSANEAFTSLIAYQTFIYHVLVIVTGYYIIFSKRVAFKLKHYFASILIILVLAIYSVYINSMFSIPIYDNGTLVSVENSVNFFFTFRPPINIVLHSVSDWYIYSFILFAVAVLCITACYIPYFIIKKRFHE